MRHFAAREHRTNAGVADRKRLPLAAARTGLVVLAIFIAAGLTSSGGIAANGPAPTVAGFNPTSGPAGTAVTITGANLTGATAVAFNGTSATSYTVDSDTQITATVPSGASSGPLSVTTPNGTGTSAPSQVSLVNVRVGRALPGG